MLFTPFFTLALAAVSLAAPAPSPVELEDRAVSFESIRIGLSVVITSYRSNPSTNNRQNLCRILNGLSQAQKTRLQNLGFDFSRVQCPSILTQLNTIESGLGAAYQAYTQNQNAQTTAALCAITSQLSASQRSRIVALGINLNVQCPSITDQLNGIQAGLGAAYQAYTRNPSQRNTAALCAITSQLTTAQQTSVTAIGINLSNVQCAGNLDQQLNAIQSGLAAAYDALAAAPTVFANQLAYCQITNRLNAQQTAQLQALNLSGAANVQCNTVLLQNRLNNGNFGTGFGDAYVAFEADPSAANRATLCGLTTQLNNNQRNRLNANFDIDVATFGCT
ncbi:hypothetical protein CYLTODRAFT_427749 [Cylindrobasidium torrendii FP15055 ss-10]|uniref:Uncharacterized protein n=1 Tax=Cylindrobasidium torrendii FP15055 ss-10 TaxID=1314674 RepID=A0A0D7ASA1_9AGAR|nr:hypothetical protein CYLTODRAFT_427749 [Cylindrobasidium torrendii FP15055 ss-10]